ncbi:hypothetical protein TVAG_404130 [Trichomonas vaginalis G3]|uniref:Molybdate-anion transporter n=1 Tax=Trichomonas vaginalis (strain ATCC PRA-98 / G3) TaxID=412133 RepID=A2EGG2_TRIV3|nr:SAM (S-adenosyl methionine) transporter family [Trichomonas vaginalis G3]EAY08245.1 hypothetical protein TVAG_404130 [Trichomonas vaginalis G3]KAI5507517.1 SAM (S-adenosyl methionine) transporter family [Trichomonas vaginalis G3]|eukprot:XP_001320468.1 hypothetical protein [Trichomonas vaginalis G3]
MNEALDTIILNSFRISLAIALIIIIYKRASAVQTINPDLKKLIHRYFSCYIALFLAAFIQMPYRCHLLLNKGLTHAQISEIFGIANIFVALWNLFMPIALKKLGHANLCIIVALSYFFNAGILAFGSQFTHFAIAGCLQGLTMPTAMMALMDYWMTEELLLPQNSNANYIFNEQRVAMSLFMSSSSSMISNAVAHNWGVEAIFSFTLSIPLASIILLVSLLHVKEKPEEKSIGGDFSKLKLWLTESPKNIIIIFTEIAFASSIISSYIICRRFYSLLLTNHQWDTYKAFTEFST